MRRADGWLPEGVVTAVEIVEAAPPSRPMDVYTISYADLQEADEDVRRCQQEWQQTGAPHGPGAEDAGQALRRVEGLCHELDQVRARLRPGPDWIYLYLAHLFARTGLSRFGRGPVLGGTAAVVCGLSLLATPLFFGTLGAALRGAAVFAVCGCCLAAAAVLLLWPSESKRLAYQRLRLDRKEWAERAEALRPAVDRAQAEYERLREWRAVYVRLEAARRRRQELADLLSGAKYQLVHADWRSLRGAEFERFLSRVFEMLGYQVEATKTSGDQGVDLIVTGKGARLAVQAKGYAGSVGNHAVMEAAAGMNLYQCASCCVVTNSHFTPLAVQLAQANHCRLIDGAEIPDLIEGRIY